ncbi:hypothetical protein ACK8P5_14225 [Paenibacillus sp. EC2-1]|uniref:hypothetical protein n=1 Tax=Paenibacillus sp. EC2-1 TaxID=3388665 RepID=UPI003BEF34B6
MDGLFQVVGLLFFILLVYTMINVIDHVNRTKKHQEQVILLLKEIKDRDTN